MIGLINPNNYHIHSSSNYYYYYYNYYKYDNSNNYFKLRKPSSLIGLRRDDSFRFFTTHFSKRVWWSDNTNNNNNNNNNNDNFNNNNNFFYSMGFDDDDDEEEGGGFGVLQDSFDTSWVFKVLNAFGWMVPAIAISMLLGTGGTNTFVMALVLPVAQSVFSFLSDTFFENSVRSSKTKRRRVKKKPFRRAQNGTDMKPDTNTEKVNENYQFRNATKNNQPFTSRNSSFGGWDELDQGLGSSKASGREPTRMDNETRLKMNGKLSRRVRTRGTPLLVRLLIAVFPFLGSWTRLL